MKFSIIFILIFISSYCFGQFDNSIFNSFKPVNPNDSMKLSLGIDNQNFLYNNEYFNNLNYGFTYLGYSFKPYLNYQPTPKVRIQAGWYFLKYSGRDEFGKSVPWFRCQYKFAKNMDLLLGNIHGTVEHKLIEPLYSFSRHYTNNPEQGIQFLGNFKHFEGDLWLNWEKFILIGDPFQEEFTLATTTKIKFFKPENKLQFSIPIQGMATHKGGQGNNNSDKLQTYFNTASGFELNYIPNINHKPKIGTSNFFVSYYDASSTHIQYYSQGWGFLSNIYANKGKFGIMFSYWYSKHFIAPRGEVILQSVSRKYGYWWEPAKQLVTAKLQFKQPVYKGINLEVRGETYYDLLRYNLDFSYSLFLVINGEFFLKKVENIN
ncbi:MAG: hypothetical protein HY951_02020 [Bacteroidia bacterium]|nr:hypothetical protein [Bacteroidia bacterium]